MDIQDKITHYLKENPAILFAFLFGSYATKQATKESDIDIALYFDRSAIPSQQEIIFTIKPQLEELTSLDADIVCLNDCSPIIGMEIAEKGILLYCTDDYALSKYHIYLFTAYADLKYLRRPIEEEILSRKYYDRT